LNILQEYSKLDIFIKPTDMIKLVRLQEILKLMS
jgi:hypothetical protein